MWDYNTISHNFAIVGIIPGIGEKERAEILNNVRMILGKGGKMSIVTIKWKNEGEQPLSEDFEYTEGGGFGIYQNLIRLLTAIEDNFGSSTKGGKYPT